MLSVDASGSLHPGLVIVGLGPGDPASLLPRAAAWLTGESPVIVRTRRHPVVQAREDARHWRSCDDLYDTADDFDRLYAAIVGRVQETIRATDQPVVYAVPGHPLFAEATVRRLLEVLPEAEVVPGLSVLDATATTLRRDPIAEGWQLLDALDLAALLERDPFASGSLIYSPVRPALVCQVYGRRIASAVKLTLTRLLPDTHPVTLVQAAGVTGHERVVTLPLFEIDRDERHSDHLTSLYVPALEPLAARRSPQTLAAIVARLRAPDGCPWDREQTHQSLAPHAIEEAYEVVEAIEQADMAALCDELGDLLLQVVLHAQVAEEAGDFTLEDVVEAISAKLVRRHPHVFGDVAVAGSADVLRNWDQIKAMERQAKEGSGEAATATPFAGIPRALPALTRAAAHLRRMDGDAAAPAGPGLVQVAEARASATPDQARLIVGRALFDLVALAQRSKVDPEAALGLAIDAYRQAVMATASGSASREA